MESYSPHITPYLMGIAEGKLIGGILRPGYSTAWIELFTNEYLTYELDSVAHIWHGNQSAIMASTPKIRDSILGVFKATNLVDAGKFQTQLDEGVHETLNFFFKTSDKYAMDFASKASHFHTIEEARSYGSEIAGELNSPNSSITYATRDLAAVIWRYRLYSELHMAYVMVEGEQELHNLLSITIQIFKRIATSLERVLEVYPAASWPGRMILHDLLDLEKGVSPLKHLSSKARNRILLQCEGHGGFQILKFGKTLEISTMFEGASGIFLRVIPSPTQNDGKYEDLKTKKVTASYDGNLTFGAAKELKERKILGWISNETNAPPNYIRVKNKSFLDHLTPGSSNMSKLILYMDWYFGGMSSWYGEGGNDTSGSLMRLEATKNDVVSYADAIKIDTHFTIGNIVACSKLPIDGSIDDLVHHKLTYRKGDIAVYTRKKTAGLALIGGFKHKDCQFDILKTLVGEQDRLDEIQ